MNTRDPDRLTIAPDGLPDEAQPIWRRDFPIDWPQDQYVARRDFAKFMVLTSLSFVVGQFWILALNALRRRKRLLAREVARIDEVPVGGALIFEYPNRHDPCVLVRLSDRGFVAYSQKCTHLSCPVIPRASEGRLHCPCHEGVFDLATGRPLQGPPRRPLARIKLQFRGDRIYAAGVEERTV